MTSFTPQNKKSKNLQKKRAIFCVGVLEFSPFHQKMERNGKIEEGTQSGCVINHKRNKLVWVAARDRVNEMRGECRDWSAVT